MPKAPLPPELRSFVAKPQPAVVATVRPDGSPATTATWFDWEAERLLLSMTADSPRARNVRLDPRISLTILGDSWYDQVTLLGRVVEFRDDEGLSDLNRLSMRYWGKPYPKSQLRCVTGLVEVERWHSWGDPAGNDT